jgi:O-antigen/teichoic acid export membrane protein
MTVNKDFLIIFLGKIFQIIIMLVAIRVTTALLNPKVMGIVYIFMTVYPFFVLALINPFGQYINRRIHTWHEQNVIMSNLAVYGLYLLFISLLSSIVGFMLYRFGVSNGMPLAVFLPLLSSFILFLTLNQTILQILNMLHYRLSFTVLTVLTSLGVLIFGYLFVYFWGNTAENWLYGTVVSNILFTLMGFYLLRKKLKEKYHGLLWSIRRLSKEKIVMIFKFVIPLAIATLFMWLQNQGYRIIVEKNISLEFLGFFGVGMAISGQIASVVESIVMQYFHPIYYKRITNTTLENRQMAINELINTVLPIYFMLALFLSFLAKNLMEILVDGRYYEAYIFAIFAIWVEFFRMATNLFGNISQSEMNTKKFMTPYVIGSIFTIIGVYIVSIGVDYKLLLPLTLVLGGFITMILMYFSMQKLIQFVINYKNIFYAFLISIPYLFVFLFDDFFTHIYFAPYSVVGLFGLYFLGTLFYIYRKDLQHGNR